MAEPDYLLRFDENVYVMLKRCPFGPDAVPEHKIYGNPGVAHPEFIRHDGMLFYFHGVKYDAKAVCQRLLTAELDGKKVIAQDKSLESLLANANVRATEVLRKRAQRTVERAE